VELVFCILRTLLLIRITRKFSQVTKKYNSNNNVSYKIKLQKSILLKEPLLTTNLELFHSSERFTQTLGQMRKEARLS